jgi:hypothetical protein
MPSANRALFSVRDSAFENRTHFDSGFDGPIDGSAMADAIFIILNQSIGAAIRFRLGTLHDS